MKKIILSAAMFGALSLSANTASANQGAMSAASGHYSSVSKACVACHADGNGQKNTVTAAWISAGGTSQTAPTNWTAFDTADSDGDGTSNKAEIEAGTAPYTNTTSTPTTPGGGGCIASAATTPLMMVLAMLSLGFFVRRKKS